MAEPTWMPVEGGEYRDAQGGEFTRSVWSIVGTTVYYRIHFDANGQYSEVLTRDLDHFCETSIPEDRPPIPALTAERDALRAALTACVEHMQYIEDDANIEGHPHAQLIATACAALALGDKQVSA